MDNSARPLNYDFVLNKPEYTNASILLVRENFGCGSSREHAPWALLDYGIKAILAVSFADIFYNNCFKNGILPITLSNNEIDELFKVSSNQKLEIEVDLPNQRINFLNDKFFEFEIDEFKKNSLINGLDEIGLTLERTQEIKNFEQGYYDIYPWLK
jgi:3-isopropylmalate/(R)-2-methylmalate dehydratase small subunit